MGQMGRPTKYSEEVSETICSALAAGATKRAAAIAAGTSYPSMREWERASEAGDKNFSGFSEAIARALETYKKRLLDRLEVASDKGDAQTTRWLLERRFRDEFGAGQKVELSGPEGGPIIHREQGPDLSRLSLDDLRQMQGLLTKAADAPADPSGD